MKMKFAVVLSLVIILGALTGCELAPSIPEIFTTVKGYNNEIIELVKSQVEGTAPESFTEDSLFTIDDSLNCKVSSSSASSLNLIITFVDWEASDGTAIGGIVELDFNYYDSPVYISSIETDLAILNYGYTSVAFFAEVFDGDPATEAFTFDHETFMVVSLIDNGKALISSEMFR